MYAIRDWTELYENSETKKRLQLGWVLVPNRHDSLAFCRLMAKGEEGLIIFGVWNLVLQLASRGRQSRRGLLCSDSGEAYTALDIAVKTRAPEAAISMALDELVKSGWLITIECADDLSESNPDESVLNPKQVSKKERKQVSKPPNAREGDIKIPKEIDNQEFGEQWELWVGHLWSKGGRPSDATLKAHLANLAEIPKVASERLRIGIDMGLRAPAKKGFRIDKLGNSDIPIKELRRRVEEA